MAKLAVICPSGSRRTLPSRRDPESVTATPPVFDSRPHVILLPTQNHAGELAHSIQSLGLPFLLAFDPEILAHWSRHEEVAGFLVHLDTPWIAEVAQTLVHGGAAVVALSDDPEVRMNALKQSFEDVLAQSMPSIEIAAKLRRRFQSAGQTIDFAEAGGPLRLELASRRVLWWDEEIQLSRILLEVLAYLAARANRWITAKELLRDVWSEPWTKEADKVRKAIRRRRKALGSDSVGYVVSKKGFGYGYFPG